MTLKAMINFLKLLWKDVVNLFGMFLTIIIILGIIIGICLGFAKMLEFLDGHFHNEILILLKMLMKILTIILAVGISFSLWFYLKDLWKKSHEK